MTENQLPHGRGSEAAFFSRYSRAMVPRGLEPGKGPPKRFSRSAGDTAVGQETNAGRAVAASSGAENGGAGSGGSKRTTTGCSTMGSVMV